MAQLQSHQAQRADTTWIDTPHAARLICQPFGLLGVHGVATYRWFTPPAEDMPTLRAWNSQEYLQTKNRSKQKTALNKSTGFQAPGGRHNLCRGRRPRFNGPFKTRQARGAGTSWIDLNRAPPLIVCQPFGLRNQHSSIKSKRLRTKIPEVLPAIIPEDPQNCPRILNEKSGGQCLRSCHFLLDQNR